MSTMRHYAVLIGIDCYMSNQLPSGESYERLGGCVRDIELVEGLLRKILQIPDERIIKLTASGTGREPTEPRERWPTYENIRTALAKVADTASSGDHVYIHYAGHGGRASTAYEEVKGGEGIDEALVPIDIGDGPERYLRDVEVAGLFRAMVVKGLIVFVVLDCCHSGGMTRGDARRRGIASVDTRRVVDAGCVVTADGTLSVMKERYSSARSIGSTAGLLPEPEGYTVLAACRKTEFAHEANFDGQTNGVLTYWLLQFLPQIGAGMTYKTLCDRIIAKVHSQFREQTPMVMGEVDRVVFGVEKRDIRYTANVMNEHATHGVLLDVGRAHGVTKGARFVVFPAGMTSFDGQEDQVASLKIREVEATQSWADVVERSSNSGVFVGGEPAIVVGPTNARLIRGVELLDIDEHPWRGRLEDAVRRAGWVELAAAGRHAPSFQVRVDKNDEFELLDGGGMPLPWLRPAISSAEPEAIVRLVARLEHLSRYLALQELSNNDRTSPLSNGLEVQLLGWADDHDPCAPFEPSGRFNGSAEMKSGQWTALRIRNSSRMALNVCLFDLQPGWSAEQMWPLDGAGFRTLDPGAEEILALQVHLPDGYDDGIDVLKVFATIGTTDFRWLELPAIDEPTRRNELARTCQPSGALETMLAAFSRERPATRHVVATRAGGQWVTGQVELRVSRAPRCS